MTETDPGLKILHRHIVPEKVERQRLSDYAVSVFQTFVPSRKGIKKAIKRGAILVDGIGGTTGHWVLPGQIIDLIELTRPINKVFELPLVVVYEDEDIAVVHKPAGVPTSGNRFRTIFNALPFNLKSSSKLNAFAQPRPVHRLDAATTGLLLIAKTPKALITMGRHFEHRAVKKRYQAVIIGRPSGIGTIRSLVKGVEAISHYQVVRSCQSLKSRHLSLLNLWPETGRTHQLRIHLSDMGCPILGDKLYGREGMIMRGKGLFLSAVQLNFSHPISGEKMNLSIDPPRKFNHFMDKEQERWERYRLKNEPNS